MKKIITALFVALSFFNAGVNAAIIDNGDFETGTLDAWSCTDASFCFVETPAAHSGIYFFQGFANDGVATLSQSFATDIGTSYDLEFWSKTSQLSSSNILRFDINGSGPISVAATTDWLLSQYAFEAQSALTTLNFLFQTDFASGVWKIDDVAVSSGVSAVPIPAAAFLFVPALLGFFGLRRQANKVAAT